MYSDRIIKKILGDFRGGNTERQGFIDNLESKSKIEIQDLLERQNKLLENKSFISKLPDKGKKILKFQKRLQAELAQRNEVELAANLLSRLNIVSEGKAAMNDIEWTGKYHEKTAVEKIVELDSDDEEDPLKILAQPTGAGVHKKKIITLAPEKPLINEEDLKEIESLKKDEEALPQHVRYIVKKMEDQKVKKEHFKPYKTTKSNVHDLEKEKSRKRGKYWEVTAATPPLIVHGIVKELTINESLKLQKEQNEKLREIQTNHAMDRLIERVERYTPGAIPDTEAYRSERDDSVDSNADTEEEHEVHDEEDNDTAGNVVFTVDSIIEF